jgi:DNA-binding FrmR family transcriptional regulator
MSSKAQPVLTPLAPGRELIRKRLNRIAGQVAGLQRMVDDERYCVDILTQVAAVRSALDALGTELLTQHLATCVIGHAKGDAAHADAKGKSVDHLVDEVRTTLARFLK